MKQTSKHRWSRDNIGWYHLDGGNEIIVRPDETTTVMRWQVVRYQRPIFTANSGPMVRRPHYLLLSRHRTLADAKRAVEHISDKSW